MKQGFVIARSSRSDKFFTATSSYQRSEWTNVTEATTYPSKESADSAVKKLWVVGEITAVVRPVTEAEFQFSLPNNPEIKPAAEEPMADIGLDDELDNESDVEDEMCDVCSEPECVCEPPEDEAVTFVIKRELSPADQFGESQLDEVSRSKLSNYVSVARGREADAASRGETVKDRTKGIKLALQKRWGDNNFGIKEPKVKGTDDLKEDDGQAFSKARFLPDQKVKYNAQPGKSFCVVQDSGTGVVQIRECGKDTSDPISVDTSTLVKEAFELLPKDDAPNVRAAKARDEERNWHKQHGDTNRKWVVRDSSGKQYGNPMSKEAAQIFASKNPAAVKARAKPVLESETMPAKPIPDGKNQDNDSLIPNLKNKVDDLKFNDPTVVDQKDPDTKLTHATAESDPKTPVKVPADLKAKLTASVAEFKKIADISNGRDDAKAAFAMTCQSAMQELLDLLNAGTVESIKMAQVKMTSWMNPITTNIPHEVRDFVLRGGMKPSLKNLFDTRKASKENK